MEKYSALRAGLPQMRERLKTVRRTLATDSNLFHGLPVNSRYQRKRLRMISDVCTDRRKSNVEPVSFIANPPPKLLGTDQCRPRSRRHPASGVIVIVYFIPS